MYRGTTPEYILHVIGYDLTDKSVFVTIEYAKTELTITNDRLTVTYTEPTTSNDGYSEIQFTLTQEETLSFKPGIGSVQVRFIGSDGMAEATEYADIEVRPILKDGVIEYGGA